MAAMKTYFDAKHTIFTRFVKVLVLRGIAFLLSLPWQLFASEKHLNAV